MRSDANSRRVSGVEFDQPPSGLREYISSPPYSAVLEEMERIRALFHPTEGDAEDLVTYAKEVVKLRSRPRYAGD